MSFWSKDKKTKRQKDIGRPKDKKTKRHRKFEKTWYKMTQKDIDS